MSDPSTPSPGDRRRLRLLILWGNQHVQLLLEPVFLRNPKYECEIISSAPAGSSVSHRASPLRLWRLRQRLKRGEFDLVISSVICDVPWPRFKRRIVQLIKAIRFLFSHRFGQLDTFWTPLLLSGKVREQTPLAVVDQMDTSFVVPDDLRLLQICTLYFKSNLYHLPINTLLPLRTMFGYRPVLPHLNKLRPWSNGVDGRFVPETVPSIKERDIDILFTGTISRPMVPGREAEPDYTRNWIRQDIYQRCQKLAGKIRFHGVDRAVPPEEYVQLLRRSRLVICTESFGCETGRIYEVAVYGGVPVINWPYTQNYKMLRPNEHALYFSLIGEDFEQVVLEALSQPEKLERMAREARAFTIREKERQVLGEYVVEETLREFARTKNAEPPPAMQAG